MNILNYLRGPKEINPRSESVLKAFGISEEREKEMEKIVEDLREKSYSISTSLRKIWEISHTPEECIWMCYLLGISRREDARGFIQSLLQETSGKSGKNVKNIRGIIIGEDPEDAKSKLRDFLKSEGLNPDDFIKD